MRKLHRYIIACIVCAVALEAVSAPFQVVKAAGTGKEPVSLENLKCTGDAANLFRQVLEQDLKRSGWFEIEAGRFSNFTISGVAAVIQGGGLETRIQVAWTGGSFSWGDSTVGVREARWQAHRLSDEVVRRVKGCQGMAATRIAFVGKEGRGGSICIADSDGYGLQRFEQESTSPLSPYFSPDGKSIYYTSFIRNYACVYRFLIQGGKREALANFTGMNSGGAVSPDGRLVAVILSQPGNPELYCINTSTRKATRLTNTPRAAEASPTWSPDGEHIAYVSDATGSPQIYVIDSATKKATRVSMRGSQNVAPSWGPDGRIAYSSKQGNFNIVVYDPRTGVSKTITDGGADYEDPSWAPDGRHIICSKREGRACTLWVLDTEGDKAVKLGLPIGDWRAPDWSGPIR